MRFAMGVECGRFWIGAETNRAVLMSHTRERDAVSEEQISGEETLVAIMAMNTALRLPAHQLF